MNELAHVNLGHAGILQLRDQLLRLLLVYVLLESLDIPLKVNDPPLN